MIGHISCGCRKRSKKRGGLVPGHASGGRADKASRSPFSRADNAPSMKEHVGPHGAYSPMWGYDKRTPEERRGGKVHQYHPHGGKAFHMFPFTAGRHKG
jgi:hypothetical protein